MAEDGLKDLGANPELDLWEISGRQKKESKVLKADQAWEHRWLTSGTKYEVGVS